MADEVETYASHLKDELSTKYHVIIKNEAIACAEELVRGPLCATFAGETVEEKLRHLLTEACELIVSRIHDGVDVKKLDCIHYKLLQFLVEKAELVKEIDHCSKAWLRRLDQELCSAELELALFFGRSWEPSSSVPEFIKELEISCHTLHLALENADLFGILNHLIEFLNLIIQFLSLIRHKYFHIMVVDCSQVVEVASRVTGVPAPRLPTNLVNTFPKVTRPLLGEMVVDHGRVINDLIDSFANLNTEKNWEPGLRRTFLFLGPTGVGKTQLAKAIALHFYGDLDRLIQIDTSMLTKSDLLRLVDYVAARPYDVILFEKIEHADPVVLENISDILSRGVGVGFSNTIIMTSGVGSEHLDGPVFGISQRVIDEARKFFKPELMDHMDGIFVFWKLRSQIIVTRLLIRHWVESVNKRSMVVYPSAAISEVLHKKGIRNGKDIKKWLAENMFPTLSEMVPNCKSDETFAVYVDTLVGSTELSFRLESCLGNLVEDWYFELTKRSLKELMVIYRTERKVINLTLQLEGICSDLKDRLNTGMFSKAMQPKVEKDEVAALISPLKDLLLLYQKSLGSMCQCPNVEAMPVAMGINNDCQKEEVKEGIRFLKNKLQERGNSAVKLQKRGRGSAVHFIGNRVLRSMKVPAPPQSKPFGVYLLLGFDGAGKIKLKDEVAELLVGMERVKPLIQVDLSDKSRSQPLLFSALSDRNGRGRELSVVEAVRRWPYCVVVFDNIEEINASVYRSFLQILDKGILHCDGGPTVDFRSTTFVLISNLGNKDRIARAFGRSYQNIDSRKAIQQEGNRFRSELLNRVDDVLFFLSASQETIGFNSRAGFSSCDDHEMLVRLRQATLRQVFVESIPRCNEYHRCWAVMGMLTKLLLGPFKWLRR